VLLLTGLGDGRSAVQSSITQSTPCWVCWSKRAYVAPETIGKLST